MCSVCLVQKKNQFLAWCMGYRGKPCTLFGIIVENFANIPKKSLFEQQNYITITKPSILGEVEIRIYIGSVLYIWYNVDLFIHIIFLTPDKHIYNAVYFRGGWNPNLYRFSFVYLIQCVFIHINILLDKINAFTKTSILAEIEIRIYIGSQLIILYNVYWFIFFFTPDKCIYKAVDLRGGWNPNLYRFR